MGQSKIRRSSQLQNFSIYFSLIGIFFALSITGVLVGPTVVAAKDTLRVMVFPDAQNSLNTIIWDIRIPRVLVSSLTGACLGLAGALIQLSTRSTLGDPNLFGIGGGAAIFLAACAAGLLVVTEIGIFLGCVFSSLGVSLILGGLVSTRDLSAVKVAIMGIALSALMVSIGISVMSHGRVFPTQVIGLIAGSFSGSNWEMAGYMLVTFLFSICLAIGLCKNFFPIMLGDTLSRSLGVNAIFIRYLAMGLAGILAGASVYAGGLIGFVGLISPHVSRRMFGNLPINLVVASALVGAILTLGSEQIARLLLAPAEFPVGLTTTIIGAPVMIYMGSKLK